MSSTIIVPEGFAYVGGALVSTFWLLAFQTMRVGRARKRAQIDYPAVYADAADAAKRPEAMVFNCTQRAHQNTLETLPMVIVGTLITGLRYPYLAAGLCGLFTLSRISYTIGYSSGVAKARLSRGGNLSLHSTLVLVLTSTWTVANWIRAGL